VQKQSWHLLLMWLTGWEWESESRCLLEMTWISWLSIDVKVGQEQAFYRHVLSGKEDMAEVQDELT
jgi:hypothetical protein